MQRRPRRDKLGAPPRNQPELPAWNRSLVVASSGRSSSAWSPACWRALKPGDDKLSLLWTIVLGIAGALLAWFIGGAVGWYAPGEPAGFIASVVGAIVLLFLYGMLRKKKG